MGLVAVGVLAMDTAAAAAEGVVFTGTSDSSFEWNLPQGEYFVKVKAGPDGASLDAANLDRASSQHDAMMPHSGFSSLLEVETGEKLSMTVLDGSVRVVMARADFSASTRSRTAGTVEPGACQAFLLFPEGLLEMYVVNATGDAVEFAFYDIDLRRLSKGESNLEGTFDHNAYPTEQLLVQACNPDGAAPAPFRIRIHYEDAPIPIEKNVVPQGFPWFALAVATAIVFLSRRNGA